MIAQAILKKLPEAERVEFAKTIFQSIENVRERIENKRREAFSASISMTSSLSEKIEAKKKNKDLEFHSKLLLNIRNMCIRIEEPLGSFTDIIRDKEPKELTDMMDTALRQIDDLIHPLNEEVLSSTGEYQKEFIQSEALNYLLKVEISKNIYMN